MMRRRLLSQLHRPAQRCFSSNRPDVQSYLKTWVGSSGNATRSAAQMHLRQRHQQSPLLVSGTSYLLATLRLDRHDTPDSLEVRLSKAGSANGLMRKGSWKCPVVLDLSALAPDGSPHHIPPKPGFLLETLNVLNQHGIVVMGLTGTPRELEDEALQQGLPALLSGRSMAKFDIQDVIHVIAQKQSQTEIFHDEPEVVMSDVSDDEIQEEVVEERNEIINASPRRKSEEGESSVPPSTAEGNPNFSASTVIHGSVRSGQQVCSAPGQSLVILGSVSSGGEVMSDGDIFIFGKLRGRALAGLNNEQAKIVATSFDPELVGIGDVVKTGDGLGGGNRKQATAVSLNGKKEMIFEPFHFHPAY